MTENMKAIMRAAAEDEELKAEAVAILADLDGASDEERDAVVARALAFADERGFELTEEDLVFEPSAEGTVEDEELAVVSGGCSGCGLNAKVYSNMFE